MARGFSLLELTVLLAVIGVLSGLAAPSLVGFWRTASLQAGARELASVLNVGRQLAISRKTPVCVDVAATGVRLRMGGCSGSSWTGALTDGSGLIRISDPATLEVSSNARVMFTPLGAAAPSATYTVRHVHTLASRAVVVAGSGRISVE